MERVVTATQARVHFGEIMRHVVEDGTPVVVERSGKPQVVLLSVEAYERLRAGQLERPDWRELVRRSRQQIREALTGRSLPPPEDTIREGREERDEQLLGHLYRRGYGD
ncbi:MAG: type II toxin-antitoxin system Phd/YefM family antitoxin, partial [Dehalococcoidia bacterium]